MRVRVDIGADELPRAQESAEVVGLRLTLTGTAYAGEGVETLFEAEVAGDHHELFNWLSRRNYSPSDFKVLA